MLHDYFCKLAPTFVPNLCSPKKLMSQQSNSTEKKSTYLLLVSDNDIKRDAGYKENNIL